MVVLTQPEPKWNGCRRFQGVRKSSRAEGWCPVQRKLCGSPGMVCARARAWGCSVGTRETPGREAFRHRRDQLLELLCQGVTAFLSKSVLLLKAFCFASLPFPHNQGAAGNHLLLRPFDSPGFGGWRCSPHAGPVQQGWASALLVLSRLLEVTDLPARSGHQRGSVGQLFLEASRSLL